MQIKYIDKIIKIGEKESCTEEDLSFMPEPLTLCGQLFHVSRDSLFREMNNSIPSLINFIKGIHLIEMRYRKGFGFGSPSRTLSLIEFLEDRNENEAKKLYDWVAFRGGNYYIPEKETLEEKYGGLNLAQGKLVKAFSEKVRYEKIEEEKKEAHAKAVAKKEQNREKHAQRSKENTEKRNEELFKLSQMNELEQLKYIINSNYPLYFFPKEFSNIDNNILLKLTLQEKQNLIDKIKSTNKKGPWKSIANKLSEVI